MSGIYYAFSIVAVFVIIRWFIKNDGHTETSGLLATKAKAVEEAETDN